MSYCLNPHCKQPQNSDNSKFCLTCGAKLLLRERYRAIKPIGFGGFGKTFLALDEDKPSRPPCVIKQFFPQTQGSHNAAKAAELFQQEAVRLDQLGKHPQIPDLLAHFEQDQNLYLVQEYIEGENLEQELIRNDTFDEAKIRQLLDDLLPVLQFIHQHQVIHRDIKPANIIRRSALSTHTSNIGSFPGQLVLVDFGAAKVVTTTQPPMMGTIIGSPEYIAPEQTRGQAVYASDIYSLGVTCINLLTERSPFDSYDTHNAAWIWGQYLKTPVSQELSRIIDKMVETIPSHRYQTVDEVIKDLNFQPSSLPPKQITPPTSQPPAVVKTSTQIEKELQELKTQFTGGKPQPQNPNSQPQSSSNNPIDKELEELKARFLGNG
jgi:serine/threonine protein kinase